MENRTFKVLQEKVNATQKLFLQLQDRVLRNANVSVPFTIQTLLQEWYGSVELRENRYEQHIALAQLALLYARRNDVVLARNTLSSVQSEAIANGDTSLTGYVLACFCAIEEYLPTKIDYAKTSLRTIEYAPVLQLVSEAMLIIHTSLQQYYRKKQYKSLFMSLRKQGKNILMLVSNFYDKLRQEIEQLPDEQQLLQPETFVPRLPTISDEELTQQQAIQQEQQHHHSDEVETVVTSLPQQENEYDIPLYNVVNNIIVASEQKLTQQGILITNDIPEEVLIRTNDRQTANIKLIVQLLFSKTIPEGVISFHTETPTELTFPEVTPEDKKKSIVLICAYMPSEGEPVLHENLLPAAAGQAQAQQEEKLSASSARTGYGAIQRILLQKGDGTKRVITVQPVEQEQIPTVENRAAEEPVVQNPQHERVVIPYVQEDGSSSENQFRRILNDVIRQQTPTEAIQTISEMPIPQQTQLSRLQRNIVSALAQEDMQRVHQIINEEGINQQTYPLPIN